MKTTHELRVLIANERPDRLARLTKVVAGLGHEVVVSEVHVGEIGASTARERPDVALVGLGESSEHALELISAVIRESFCPVIALLGSHDREFIDQAAQRGVFAYIVDSSPEELQGAIDITLRRFADFAELKGAFDRRTAEFGMRIAEEDRKALSTQRRQRRILELHDGVVQQLTVASMTLELDQHEKSREALLVALSNVRSIVRDSLAELQAEGVPLAELIKDASPG